MRLREKLFKIIMHVIHNMRSKSHTRTLWYVLDRKSTEYIRDKLL
jgi:hypothetical protein